MIFPASLSRQCDDLAQLLGTVCLPYLRCPTVPLRENSFHLACEAAWQSDTEFAMEAMNLATKSKREAIVQGGNHRSVFAIPLITVANATDEMWFAIGRSNEIPSDSGLKLIQIASEAIRRQLQIDDQERTILNAESEIERSFSERVWLQQLNAQRVIRKKTVGQQSRQSIESLRSLIDAESIAIFLYSDPESENHGLESMISGKQHWTLDDARLLIQRIQKPRCGESVVLNQLEQSLHNGICHSCVVVPIGESEPIGFVIAINRRKQSLSFSAVCEKSFSSADAVLLREVADYLDADGYSNSSLLESEQLVLGTLRAMSNAIEARDPYTHGHSERVGSVGYQIALRLHLSEVACQEIYLAGVLHRKHPKIGHRILEEPGKLKFALPGVLYHHERVDGTGYPHNLVGSEIPLMARILAVSDAYDAMTSSRVYRNAMGQQHALAILRSGMRTQWDDDVVTACLQYFSDLSLEIEETRTESSRPKSTDWRQVSQALRVLQL